MGELRPDPARHVDRAAERPGRAPTPGDGEWRRVGPLGHDRVEDEGPGERRDEILGRGGEKDEVSGDGDGLYGLVAGEEGGVAEEEALRRVVERGRGEHAPVGGDWVEGVELWVGLRVGGGEESVEGEERREGRGVDEATPRTADGK